MDCIRYEYRKQTGGPLPSTGNHRRIVERVTLARQKLPPHAPWLQTHVGMPAWPAP